MQRSKINCPTGSKVEPPWNYFRLNWYSVLANDRWSAVGAIQKVLPLLQKETRNLRLSTDLALLPEKSVPFDWHATTLCRYFAFFEVALSRLVGACNASSFKKKSVDCDLTYFSRKSTQY